MPFEYEATALPGKRYAVRPVGALGTCGWINGIPWQVQFILADSAREALQQAARLRAAQHKD